MNHFRLAALLLSLATISSAQSITFTEYPISTLGFNPNYITAGLDGAIWFTVSDSSKIGRITTVGAVTAYATPTLNSSPQGITTGPDGAIWFVEFSGNKIGRITPSGAIAEYEIPTPISGPMGITAGPDGALWFTENKGGVGSKIGRITTAGDITEYATPTPNSGPYGIAAGPDGAIWFVEYGANKIGRITMAGVITEFALPLVLYNSTQITAGPDGALWFTQFGSRLGRITTGGTISWYDLQLSKPFASAGGIARGTDGGVWFTEQGGSARIWRITSAGPMARYDLPDSSMVPKAITLSPDGALWFTEISGVARKIGRAALVFPTPTIAAVGNAADEYLRTIQGNSWVAIYGANLAPPLSGRTWGASDIIGGKLPLSLDGVSVTINGKSAFVEYISPTQINVLAPDETTTGPAKVVVTNGGSASGAFLTQIEIYSPALFTFSPPDQKYVAAILPSGPNSTAIYVAPINALGAGVPSRPSRAGDIVEVYAAGFGPVNPTPPPGQVFFDAYPTVAAVTVTIGGLDSVVLWAGLTSVGLYQLNVIVPAGLPGGDALVVATAGGVQSQGGIFIPVQQ
jgi:uncharacterized protein (TIGR03437 family)